MANEQIMADLRTAIETGDFKLAESATEAAVAAKIPVGEIIGDGLGKGMEVIGKRFDAAEIYLPQVIVASKVMETALHILEPLMSAGGGSLKGTVVFGTVKGDIHEIGKNVCCAMLLGAGYKVIDIGCDVDGMKFIDTAEENDADVIAGSALMTTTLESQRELVALRDEMENRAKVVVGGAPCSQMFADSIHADGYSATANEVLALCDKLTKE